MDRFSRRAFLKLAGAAAGALAFAPLGSVFAKTKKEGASVSVGMLESFKTGTPELVEKEGLKAPVIVFRQEGGVSVFSAKCTHLGCTVAVDKSGTYSCPCHGSQFNYDGTVKKGPARKSLATLAVQISDAGEVLVGA
jgi:Rieske Fe-S protein